MNSSFSTKTRCTWVVLLESWYKPSFPYNNFSQYCEILPKCCKIAYIVKNLIFHDSFFWSCKFDVLWYFHQLRSCRMGAFVMNYVNTAHDAVKYCTNTPKEYKLPWIKCLLIYIFLGMYWELHGLGSSRMGPCRRISIMLWNSVQIPQNGMTDTEYFLALIIFCQKYNIFLSNTKWFNIFFIYSIGDFISSDRIKWVFVKKIL